MAMNFVKATCKNCNGQSPADQFKLHHALRMMVCPSCYTGKTQKQQEGKSGVQNAPAKSEIRQEAPKPAGWDKEDDYLEKMTRLKKQENQAIFTKIPNSEFLQCTCSGCKYGFRYHPTKKIPKACPYCNREVPRVNPYNL